AGLRTAVPGTGGRPESVRHGGARPPEDLGDAAVAGRPKSLEAAAGQAALRARDGCGRRSSVIPVHRLDHGAAGGTGTTLWARTECLSAGEGYAIHHDYGTHRHREGLTPGP